MNEIVVAAIGAVPATIAALAAWRASYKAERNSRSVANGWTRHIDEKLGEIRGLLQAHVNDHRAHRR